VEVVVLVALDGVKLLCDQVAVTPEGSPATDNEIAP